MSDSQGIFVTVSIKCLDGDKVFDKTYNFWLPKDTIDAALSLREKIYANRALDIPDSSCIKSVTFRLKREPTPAFKLILKALEMQGIQFQVIKEY